MLSNKRKMQTRDNAPTIITKQRVETEKEGEPIAISNNNNYNNKNN